MKQDEQVPIIPTDSEFVFDDRSKNDGPQSISFTPEQHISHYSPAQWESFIKEWLTSIESEYISVRLMGGPGDGGVDIAAFLTPEKYEGEWDCYQAKHYAKSLTCSDAFPEIYKMLLNSTLTKFTLPRMYYFVAPHNCGRSLEQLLSTPTKLRDDFIMALAENKLGLTTTFTGTHAQTVLDLAAKTDFSRFSSLPVADVLEIHQKTPHFGRRFPGELAPRPKPAPPPSHPHRTESRFVQQLIEVYEEKHVNDQFDIASLSTHPEVGEHFSRQRFAFYKAESLRVYARDAVPEGTFEALENDVYNGVIDTCEDDHPNGFSRLRKVMTASGSLDLSGHVLITRTDQDDRHGICHRLANADKLTWIGEA